MRTLGLVLLTVLATLITSACGQNVGTPTGQGFTANASPTVNSAAATATPTATALGAAATAEAPDTEIGKPVPASVLQALTNIPQQAWASVSGTGAVTPTAVAPTNPSSGTSTQVLWVGAEFCPYCAAERWPFIVALSRFGQFQGLKLMESSSAIGFPNTPTFTFHGATYTSQYVDLQTLETADRAGQPLETPTAAQQVLLNKYDAPPYAQSKGEIPLVLVNQRYLWIGTFASPALFTGRTWQSIADSLANPTHGLPLSIVANANMITATICAQDGNQPASVCNNLGVQTAALLLPTPEGP